MGPEGRSGCGVFSLSPSLDPEPSFFVFGGCDPFSSRFFSDLWRFDVAQQSWSEIDIETIDETIGGTSGLSEGILGRWNFSTTFIHPENVVLCFGGETSNYRQTDDILLIDPKTWTLERLSPLVPAPSPRCLHASVALERKVYVIGGTGGPSTCLTDVWELDAEVMRWREIAVSSSSSSSSSLSPFVDGLGRRRPLLGASAFSLDDRFVFGLFGGRREGGEDRERRDRQEREGERGGERETDEKEEREREREEEEEEESRDSRRESEKELETPRSTRARSRVEPSPSRQSRAEKEKEREREEAERERRRKEREREKRERMIPDSFSSLLWAFDSRVGKWTQVRVPEAESRYGRLLSQRSSREGGKTRSSAAAASLLPFSSRSPFFAAEQSQKQSEELSGEFGEVAGRWKSCVAFDPLSSSLLLKGGEGAEGVLGDSWELDLSSVVGGDAMVVKTTKRVSWIP